jgi:hypothetical protein
MVITKGKCIVAHISPCFYSRQNNASPGHVILLIGFGLGFDHKETTETHSDLNILLQQ